MDFKWGYWIFSKTEVCSIINLKPIVNFHITCIICIKLLSVLGVEMYCLTMKYWFTYVWKYHFSLMEFNILGIYRYHLSLSIHKTLIVTCGLRLVSFDTDHNDCFWNVCMALTNIIRNQPNHHLLSFQEIRQGL